MYFCLFNLTWGNNRKEEDSVFTLSDGNIDNATFA